MSRASPYASRPVLAAAPHSMKCRMIVVATNRGPYRIKDLQLVDTTPRTCTFHIHCESGLPCPQIGAAIRIVGDDFAYDARIVHLKMRAGRGRVYCWIEPLRTSAVPMAMQVQVPMAMPQRYGD